MTQDATYLRNPGDQRRETVRNPSEVERAGSRRFAGRGGIGAGLKTALGLYVAGKHPAWRDFIDRAALPLIPEALDDFHRRLRPMIETACSEGGSPARLAVWQHRGRSVVVLILPSRDAADPATGISRPSPLFLGLAAALPAELLLAFAAARLNALAWALIGRGAISQEQFNAKVCDAAEAWQVELALKTPPHDILVAPTGLEVLFVSAYERLEPSAADSSSGDFTSLTAPPPYPIFSATTAAGGVDADVLLQAMRSSNLVGRRLRRQAATADAAAGAAPDPRSQQRRATPPSPPAQPLPQTPAPHQQTPRDTAIVFSTENQNSLTLHFAALARQVGTWGMFRVMLIARNGSIRLASADGLSFHAGGARDCIVTQFTGAALAIHKAMDGLSFTPRRGFVGAASLEIQIYLESGPTHRRIPPASRDRVVINVVDV